MADIDRAVAQSIVDKRLALEESHFSQRMLRQQQLLEISEARVRELEDENKKLISRLAAADARKSKHEEEATLLQLNLQRARDELSEFKEKLAETRDAGVIEVASASAMHARETREQQQAAVEAARSFTALLQQRDAKIAELSRLVSVLSPPKVRLESVCFTVVKVSFI
jgi:major membrane immunogen (membrane-anchored lipoprotein)